MKRPVGASVVVGAALTATVLMGAPAAAAGGGAIDHVATADGAVQVVFSLPDLPAATTTDLDSIEVTIDGETQKATAEPAGGSSAIDRVTVLAIDTSQSMAGDPFDAARAAALSFVDQSPADVQIGLVAFADSARLIEQPTTDRQVLQDAIGGLSLSKATQLYEGVQLALETLPDEASGSVLVLTDGRDTSESTVSATLRAVGASDARVDVVALQQRGTAFDTLVSIAEAGGGAVTNTDDPEGLQAVFEEQARVLATQMLVSFDVPPGWDGGDSTLQVAVDAAGTTYSDSAFIRLPAAVEERAAASGPLAVDEPRFAVTKSMMIGGLVAVGVGAALVIALMTGVFSQQARASVDDRLAPYGLTSVAHSKKVAAGSPGVVAKAVEATDRAISGGGLDARLAKKLEAAGMSVHAAEWLLLHAGIALGAGLVGFVLTSSIAMAGIFLVAGAVVPWFYLSRKASKRIKKFDSQLAETLQLVSGSLSAGLSMTQSFDTVVREGNEPVSGEFRRALVEQRLGVEIETALEGVAERMHSKDFAWVVMAVRIQREVGGNLAELLLTVAATLRERAYLRRQVRTLSAEGRMSAWVLGSLPPGFFGYLMLTQPEYLDPMFSDPLGWMMLGAAAVMMALGVVVLSKLVKVEV